MCVGGLKSSLSPAYQSVCPPKEGTLYEFAFRYPVVSLKSPVTIFSICQISEYFFLYINWFIRYLLSTFGVPGIARGRTPLRHLALLRILFSQGCLSAEDRILSSFLFGCCFSASLVSFLFPAQLSVVDTPWVSLVLVVDFSSHHSLHSLRISASKPLVLVTAYLLLISK